MTRRASADTETVQGTLALALGHMAPGNALFETTEGALPALLDAALLAPLREVVARPSKQIRSRLLELLYRVAGGQPGGLPAPVPLLIEALHEGSLIIAGWGSEPRRRSG